MPDLDRVSSNMSNPNNTAIVAILCFQFAGRLRDVRCGFAKLLGEAEAGQPDPGGDDHDKPYHQHDADHWGSRPVAAG
mgnify:CR=1 FL=1